MKYRIIYATLFTATIVIGLLSREFTTLPLVTGDALYAVMVYWGFRFLLIFKPKSYSLILSIVFCFGIEFLQLIQHPILVEWRNDPLLKLIFGQGFLWTDLIAYCTGIFLSYLLDRKLLSFILKQK